MGNKWIATDDVTEACPQKCARSKDVSTTKVSSAISDSDDDVIMDAPPPANKRGIIIELVTNLTQPTEWLNRNNATRQGTFEDVNWETRRLETEDEK